MGVVEVKYYEWIKFEGVGVFQGIQVDYMGVYVLGWIMVYVLVDGVQVEYYFVDVCYGYWLFQE